MKVGIQIATVKGPIEVSVSTLRTELHSWLDDQQTPEQRGRVTAILSEAGKKIREEWGL